MTDVRVKDHPGLVRRDQGYIVSTNDDEYRQALARRKQASNAKAVERRLDMLEGQLKTIIELLGGKNGN